MKNIIKKICNKLGFYISKISVNNTLAYQTVLALNTHNINVVLDVGANVGQFARELRKYGYLGKIVSFEPSLEAYEKLVKQAGQDANWIVHPRCAIGAYAGETQINVSGNSVSSSILPMLNKHISAAPESKYTHKETVSLIALDSVYNKYCEQGENVFMKVDTQGYEWEVLDGAAETLVKCKGISLELSLVPLYEGQKLWVDCESRLNQLGIYLYAVQPCFTDSQTGQTLQVDGLFFRLPK
jgi:FkbM family methyltransferase